MSKSKIIPGMAFQLLCTLIGTVVFEQSGFGSVECSSCQTYVVDNRPVTTSPVAFTNDPMLRVGTYNIHGEVSDFVGLRYDLNRLNNRVDVWAFQEVRGQNAAETFARILPPDRWHVTHMPLNNDSAMNDIEGQAIVSRHPFVDGSIGMISLPALGSKKRAVLIAMVELPGGGRTWIMNTDHETEIGRIGMSARSQEVVALLNAVKSYDATPVVVMGDFNTSGTSFGVLSEVEVITLNRSFGNLGFHTLPGFTRTPTIFFGYQLDHIFSRGLINTGWNVFSGRKGSDHYPVIATFRLSEKSNVQIVKQAPETPTKAAI